MIIYIDIDKTICNTPKSLDYNKSTPIKKNINKANRLFDNGHTIIYWTARGTRSNKRVKKLTISQLIKWGAKYHKIKFKKPYYDIFIDDKAINTKDWK